MDRELSIILIGCGIFSLLGFIASMMFYILSHRVLTFTEVLIISAVIITLFGIPINNFLERKIKGD